MSTAHTCPFCSYRVVPATGTSGALVCPLCRNTGKTSRPDAATFERRLDAFQTRIVAHLSRLQQLVREGLGSAIENPGEATGGTTSTPNRVAPAMPAATPAGTTTGSASAIQQELQALRADMDALAGRSAAVETALAIRMATAGPTHDEAQLQARVQRLGEDLRSLSARVRSGSGPKQSASTPRAGPTLPAMVRHVGERAPKPRPDDFSDVPPVMREPMTMRESLARDALRMPRFSSNQDDPGDPLVGIERALDDIDHRLRSLRER